MKHLKCENKNGNVIIPVPESYSDCVTLIRSDFFVIQERICLF